MSSFRFIALLVATAVPAHVFGLRLPISAVAPHNTAASASTALRHAQIRCEDDGRDTDPEVVISEAVDKMKKSVANVQDQLGTLRVGRASPSLLDRVSVNYYDTPTPLNQLASVTAPTASQLVVDVYDKSAIGDVERALMESDLGMTPNSDGKVIRLNVPALTTERRKELTKTAKSLGEDGKVALRNIRKGAIDKIKKMKKALGEDVVKDKEDDVQKAIKKYEDEVGKLVDDKNEDIMKV